MIRRDAAMLLPFFAHVLIVGACGNGSEADRTAPTRTATNVPTVTATTTRTATVTPAATSTRQPTETPTTTPTVTATPMNTQTPGRLTYVLIEESRLTYQFTTRGDWREPLVRGSMEVIARGRESNESFEFEITRFDFETDRFHLTGHEGFLRTTPQDGKIVLSMQVLVDVAGGFYFEKAVELSSCGSASSGRFSGYPPRLQELVICGGKSELLNRRFSLIVVIFAEPAT